VWPWIVDGFIVVASLAVLQAVPTGRKPLYPWLLVLGISALSVTFTVLHAPRNLVAQLVAAIPPLALVLSFELLMRQIHHRLEYPTAWPTAVVPASPPATQRIHGSSATEEVAQAGRSLDASEAARPPSPGGKATRSPRAVTLARARELLLELHETGRPVTTAALAERLGVSAGYARRLLRELNDETDPSAPTNSLDGFAGPSESRAAPGLRAVAQ
jgi:Protein of unknown function (DUF2637)